jgi:hypothetical protein
MWEAAPVHPVEREIGYRFRDRTLLRGATGTWHRSFGPLEHLGDTIADLAVGVTCHRLGIGPDVAATLVDNVHLERVMASRLRRLVRPRTGDVIEALVGAVHLDGGFDRAAEATVRLLVPDARWEPLPESPVPSTEAPVDGPVWLGALVLDAAIADHLLRRWGPVRTSQRELSHTRSHIVRTTTLDRLVAEVPAWRAAGLDARRLKGSVASTLLRHGWSPTRDHLVGVLVAHRLLDTVHRPGRRVNGTVGRSRVR